MIKISTVGGKSFEGEVFAVDPVTKTVVIKNEDMTYTIVNSAQISQITGEFQSIETPNIAKLGIRLVRVIFEICLC